jgi:hypothetical protein
MHYAAAKGRRSFLKKGSKKLLSVSGASGYTCLGSVPRAMSKSFLLLFFKKEESSFLPLAKAEFA